MSDKDSLKPLIESLIFASESAVSIDRLLSVLEGEEKTVIKEAVSDLIDEYRSAGRGIFIEEVAGGYQFRTNPESSPWLRKLFKIGLQKISKAAMESLAIIAYKQPVTRGELEAIRGVDSGGVLATLMEKRFIKIVGRKEVPGRPVVYGTTKEFLETFDLKDLSCLPSLKDIQKMEEEHAAETQGLERDSQSPIEDPVQDQTDDKAVEQDGVQEDSGAEARGEVEDQDEGRDLDAAHEDPDQDDEDGEGGLGATDPFEGGFGTETDEGDAIGDEGSEDQDEDNRCESPGRQNGEGPSEDADAAAPSQDAFDEDERGSDERKASEDNSFGGDNIEEEGGGAHNPGAGDGKPGDGN